MQPINGKNRWMDWKLGLNSNFDLFAFIYVKGVSEDKKQGTKLIKEQKSIAKTTASWFLPPWFLNGQKNK